MEHVERDTLVLEWPKIILKIKLPIPIKPTTNDKEIIYENGRYYKLVDYETQSELQRLQKVHDLLPNIRYSL